MVELWTATQGQVILVLIPINYPLVLVLSINTTLVPLLYIYKSLTIDMCTILRLIHHVIFFGFCHPVPHLAVLLHL